MEPNGPLDSLKHMRDDKLLTRISALLRQAENTDNEHEAETFMQAAQRLATASSIDLAVARARLDDGMLVWLGARGGVTRVPVALTR